MVTMKRALACVLPAIALATACDGAPPEGSAGRPDPRGTAAAIVAERVTLRIPESGGELVIAADALALGDDGRVALDGDVRVTSGSGRLEARAERLDIAAPGGKIALSGGVRATFTIEGGDGGAR